MTARSILQIVSRPGRIVGGEILYRQADGDGTTDIAALDPAGEAIRAIRGREIAMIFQEPMTACRRSTPSATRSWRRSSCIWASAATQARERAIEMLGSVGMPRPEQRIDDYPFQLSRRHAPAGDDRDGAVLRARGC